MTPTSYQTIFEITQKGFTWWFAVAGFIPGIVGLALLYWRKRHEVSGRIKYLSYFFPAFTLIWLFGVTIPMWRGYERVNAAYRSGNFSIVEGPVEDFRPMPPQGHTCESFRVQTATFCYGDDIISAGFNNDTQHGGPIRAGMQVRIAYVGDNILRIEAMK